MSRTLDEAQTKLDLARSDWKRSLSVHAADTDWMRHKAESALRLADHDLACAEQLIAHCDADAATLSQLSDAQSSLEQAWVEVTQTFDESTERSEHADRTVVAGFDGAQRSVDIAKRAHGQRVMRFAAFWLLGALVGALLRACIARTWPREPEADAGTVTADAPVLDAAEGSTTATAPTEAQTVANKHVLDTDVPRLPARVLVSVAANRKSIRVQCDDGRVRQLGPTDKAVLVAMEDLRIGQRTSTPLHRSARSRVKKELRAVGAAKIAELIDSVPREPAEGQQADYLVPASPCTWIEVDSHGNNSP